MTPTQRISDTLREKRLQKKDLAAAIGVPPTTLNSWINRGGDFPASFVVPISDFLSVSPLWLLTGADVPVPSIPASFVELKDDELFLIESFRALDQEGRIIVANKAVEELRRYKLEQGSAPLSSSSGA